MIGGGIHVHETVLQVNSKSTCAVMTRDRLKMCSSRGEQIPLVVDKYLSPLVVDKYLSPLVVDKYLSPLVVDKYLSPLVRLRAKAASIRVSSHIYHHWTGTELLKHSAFRVYPFPRGGMK